MYIYQQLEDRGQERGSVTERVEGYDIRNDRSTYVVGKTPGPSVAGAVNIDVCFADSASASLRWLLLRPGSCLKRVSYSVWLLGSDRVDRGTCAGQTVGARVDVFGQIREGVESERGRLSFLGS